MTLRDVAAVIESWAPRGIAWESDNPGLQVGDAGLRVRGVLVSLDLTPAVVVLAVRRRANLIVSHHPLFFRPLRALPASSETTAVVAMLLRHRIAAYAAHTNLDFTRGGTSHALAERLGLTEVRFLRPITGRHRKVVTFVPAAEADRVMEAMAGAGAGVIGEYERCSFRTSGTGTFRGSRRARPAVGRALHLEQVQEVRLEMVVTADAAGAVVAAMRRVHPYEEPAVDVYPLDAGPADFGMGVVGELRRPVALGGFLAGVRRKLGTPHLRYTGDPRRRVRTVAVCGGSGAELLADAVRAGADAFVTADVKYHAFHEAAGHIALVDAGHHETEYPVVGAVVRRLRAAWGTRNNAPPVTAAPTTNPIRYR